MGIRKFRPTSPSVRQMALADFSELTPNAKVEKSLLRPKKRTASRNNQGRITVRHRGGGAKKHYRVIDFVRKKTDVPAKVQSIQYDPNRTCYIALIAYADGEKSYIIRLDKRRRRSRARCK